MHENTSDRPVFIVGMPRSGTSLAEQILASHPSVLGAGELPYWNSVATRLESTQDLRKLAEGYLQVLAASPDHALRVIDKMPSNFLTLGLIHAALPNAHIIHMQRNPVDTCLSIYFQNFESQHSYANDLDNLAHYYKEYLRIMEHWHRALPDNTILDVSYEALVDDQEGVTRKMLAFIGLPWDEHCLNFHENQRSVGTSSNWQVRQKISKSSVERWKSYEEHIKPLLLLI